MKKISYILTLLFLLASFNNASGNGFITNIAQKANCCSKDNKASYANTKDCCKECKCGLSTCLSFDLVLDKGFLLPATFFNFKSAKRSIYNDFYRFSYLKNIEHPPDFNLIS